MNSFIRWVSIRWDTMGGGKRGQEKGPYFGHETLLQKKADRSHSVLNKAMWGILIDSNSRLLLCQLLSNRNMGDVALQAVEPAAPRWVTQQVSLLPAPTHGPTGDSFFFHCLLWRAVPFRHLKMSPTRWPKKKFQVWNSVKFSLTYPCFNSLKKEKDFEKCLRKWWF